VPDPDVRTPPSEQVPTAGPDVVPPPAPSPGGPLVMAATKLLLLAGLVVAISLTPQAAWAQAEQSPLPQTSPPEVRGGGSLSEELSQSEGVIAPSPKAATTDPGIVQPTPDAGAGTMRVIPPPGNPGGDPNLRPK
jgi:hypothetical protein